MRFEPDCSDFLCRFTFCSLLRDRSCFLCSIISSIIILRDPRPISEPWSVLLFDDREPFELRDWSWEFPIRTEPTSDLRVTDWLKRIFRLPAAEEETKLLSFSNISFALCSCLERLLLLKCNISIHNPYKL